MISRNKISSFIDLDAWKVGHAIVLEVYRTTGRFPDSERYGLISQMRRSAVSVTSNLAEGFSRVSYKEKAHLYAIACGSITELHNQVLVSRDVGYLRPELCDSMLEQIVRLQMILRKFLQKTKQIASGS